jgi:hypothetical protein
MSTGYHAVCGKCRKSACVAVRYVSGNVRFTGTTGVSPLDAAAHFIVEHCEHGDVRLVHEDEVPDGFIEVVDIIGEVVTP